MKIFDLLKKFMRKKDFYVLEYESLNNFSVTFKEITIEDINKLKLELVKFNEAISIDEKQAQLLKDTSIEFEDIENLILEITKTVSDDYRVTYYEAIQKKWDFNYFLTDYLKVYNNTLFVCNRLKSLVDNSLGETMYPILAIRKFNKKYYFWNLLDKS